MKTNSIQFEVLADGTITVTTDDLSGPNHASADKLLKQLFELAGGGVKIRKRTRLEVGYNLESAFHEHIHDGHTHQH